MNIVLFIYLNIIHITDLSLKLTKETAGFTPPLAAQMFGYVGLALIHCFH